MVAQLLVTTQIRELFSEVSDRTLRRFGSGLIIRGLGGAVISLI
jgi:uncharacterized protein YjeT (DUF2065 family)